MIPIRPTSEKEWKCKDCSWYLDAVSAINITEFRYHCLERWLERRLEQMPKAGSDSAAGIRQSRKKCPLAKLIGLWSDYLEKALSDEIVKLLKEQVPEASMADPKRRPGNLVECLLISRYEQLYSLWEGIRSGNAVRDMDLLCILAEQFRFIYKDKWSSEGINEAIIRSTGVDVCPYCGVGLIRTRPQRGVSAQLDHFIPKGAEDQQGKKPYGIFALSLFELIPSCYACNHIKSEKWKAISPYDENCQASDVIFRWKPKDLQALNSNPLGYLEPVRPASELLTVTVEAGESLDPGGQKMFLRPYGEQVPPWILEGYGNDLIMLKVAEKDPKTQEINVSWVTEDVKNILVFAYKNAHIPKMEEDFPMLDILDEGGRKPAERSADADSRKTSARSADADNRKTSARSADADSRKTSARSADADNRKPVERSADRIGVIRNMAEYYREEDYLKYPMAKLKHDIAAQLLEDWED